MTGPSDVRVAPSREDAFVRSLSEAVGGPLGEHAGQHPWWTPLRVVLVLTALAMSLGIVAKTPCLDVAGEGGTGRYTALCWSDTSQAYVDNGYAEGHWPFSSDPQVRVRYAAAWVPPLPTYVAFLSQRVTALISGSPALDERSSSSVTEVAERADVQREARIFTLVNTVLLAGVAMLAAGLLTGVRPRRPWDAAAFAAAPILVVFAPIGWDLLAAGAVAAALWGWSRHRPGVTGVAIGVGAAASPFVALLIVPALALLLWHRRFEEACRVGGSALIAWLLLMLPAYASSPEAWRASWRGYFHGPDVGSSWLLLTQISTSTPSRTVLIAVTTLALLLGSCAVVVLARRGWSFAALGTVLLAVALIISPAASPAFALLLLPLAVVSVRSWRHLLGWQVCELIHWMMLGFYLGGALAPSGGGDARAYWWAMGLRIGGLVWLIAAVALSQRAADSADLYAVEVGGGEPDPYGDLLADGGHPRP